METTEPTNVARTVEATIGTIRTRLDRLEAWADRIDDRALNARLFGLPSLGDELAFTAEGIRAEAEALRACLFAEGSIGMNPGEGMPF